MSQASPNFRPFVRAQNLAADWQLKMATQLALQDEELTIQIAENQLVVATKKARHKRELAELSALQQREMAG